jgi:hypothetical protein
VVPFLESLKSLFIDPPVPDAVFELAATHLGGVRISRRKKALQERFILPLTPGLWTASFDRPNMRNAAALKDRIEEGKRILGLRGGTVSVIIPDPCVRVFILPVDKLPASDGERAAFIRWRIGKLMPLQHDDLKLDYAAPPGRGPARATACLARESVIREYEDLFAGDGTRVGRVTVPSLSLANLVAGAPEPADGILLNMAGDYLSLMAVTDSEWTLYRQKALGSGGPSSWTSEETIRQAVLEIDNTVHFLEDREHARAGKVWLRVGFPDEGGEIPARLRERQTLPVELIDFPAPDGWQAHERTILAPLAAQIR